MEVLKVEQFQVTTKRISESERESTILVLQKFNVVQCSWVYKISKSLRIQPWLKEI